MSTIVFQQGTHTSIDSPHVINTTTMRLKLVTTPQTHQETTIFEGWSTLLQSLYSPKPTQDSHQETSYVHQSSIPKLSQKSLELCTESLGSETGSNDAVFAFPVSSLPATRSRRDHGEAKKVVHRSFPPPLTTMSGAKGFQVRPHREGGRLIIEAVEVPLMANGCFEAERSHGRLRLTCWMKVEGVFDTRSVENDVKDVEKTEEEMVVEKFRRVRRCKEDGNGDKGVCCNWEPCWVATS